MKKILLIAALLFINKVSNAQCNQYFKVKKGTNFTMSNYNAKGKLQGKTIQKVTEYSESSNGFEATFEITSVDKKGEQTLVGSSNMKCANGVIIFDMNDMFPQEQMKSFENMDITMQGENLELPNNLKVGQQLKDANMVMNIDASPMKFTFKINITDRKVIGKETLNTPAGTYNCFKVSQKLMMKTMGTIEMNSIEWFSENIGLVKSETYDKKNTLKSYTLLTTYNY
jgi:archaellum component FlaF (FlaF/FlaG flagellin family)